MDELKLQYQTHSKLLSTCFVTGQPPREHLYTGLEAGGGQEGQVCPSLDS